MTLGRLSLRDFRRFETAEYSFASGVTVVEGSNGAGKTSLLEAVFFLSCGRGLRAARQADIIRFGQNEARIDAAFVSGGREQTLSAVLPRTGRCVLTQNGSALPSPRALMGILPSVLFRPEDLELCRGGPAGRRQFMDMILCQLRPRYLDALSRYRRLHEGKTALLKKCAETPSFENLLPEYNRRMAETGAQLASFRAPLCGRLARLAGGHHGAISGGGETLALSYKTNASDAEKTLCHMEERRGAEMAAGQCLVGAHKDDLELFLDGRPLRDFGSQGQTRTAAIALKLAARDVLAEDLGEPPLLLLDDVLSELDGTRQTYILRHLEGGQVIISTCDAGHSGDKSHRITLFV